MKSNIKRKRTVYTLRQKTRQSKDYLDIIKGLKETIANREEIIERYDRLVENYEKTTRDLIGSIK